jgi:hypothetical protein
VLAARQRDGLKFFNGDASKWQTETDEQKVEASKSVGNMFLLQLVVNFLSFIAVLSYGAITDHTKLTGILAMLSVLGLLLNTMKYGIAKLTWTVTSLEPAKNEQPGPWLVERLVYATVVLYALSVLAAKVGVI